MEDVQFELTHKRISKYTSMSFRRLDADKNFAVLKREHVGRAGLAEKLPV